MTRRTALALLLAPSRPPEVRGLYGHPKAFWAAGATFPAYGVNAAFVHSGSITAELHARVRDEGARLYAEFATLNGKGYVERHPEAWPTNERGDPAPAATWFLGACPTDPGFRAWRTGQLEALLDSHDLAGVWMDYFHWHAQFEDPHPVLPETCFNDSCLDAFSGWSRIRIPPGPTAERARWILARHEAQWRQWRVETLLGWARDLRAIVRRRRPRALFGVYHCPWTDVEFDGARRRILGLDLAALARHVDVFSPMVYHGRMGRPPEWVGENVKWLSGRAGQARIWPIVQAHEVPAPEFAAALRAGAAAPATGVMMFTAQAVAADPEKLRIVRDVYLGS